MEGDQPFDRALYAGLGELGVLGANIPAEFGGMGLGFLEACLFAEELGRVLAPVPVSSSIYFAAQLLLEAGSPAQKAHWLPKLATGEAVGTFALADDANGTASVHCRNNRLTGVVGPVADGVAADFCIVTASHDEIGEGLYLVELNQNGVSQTPLQSIDPARKISEIAFAEVEAQPLTNGDNAREIVRRVTDTAAILIGFEQLGGADRALEMARDYALERMAFGRPIGSFQSIKHMLADMYVSATLARSNCYYGAWALASGAPELPVAAATVRVAATQAFQHCAKNNIQVHGGMGFTWEYDCHLFYRRSNMLALVLGSQSVWEVKLIDRMCQAEPKAA